MSEHVEMFKDFLISKMAAGWGEVSQQEAS